MNYIGIDPDMRKSGVCMLDSTGRIMTLDSLTIVDLMAFIEWNKDAVYLRMLAKANNYQMSREILEVEI